MRQVLVYISIQTFFCIVAMHAGLILTFIADNLKVYQT